MRGSSGPSDEIGGRDADGELRLVASAAIPRSDQSEAEEAGGGSTSHAAVGNALYCSLTKSDTASLVAFAQHLSGGDDAACSAGSDFTVAAVPSTRDALGITSATTSPAAAAAERAAKASPFPAPHGWAAVLAIALNSSFNAFLCMNFSATQAASAAALGIAEGEVASFYSVYLFCCLLFMTPVMWQTERHESSALGCSVAATAVAAWTRWWALAAESRNKFGLCLLSQALVGFGAAAISTLPGQISHQRFPASQWALATSLMLMANYSGWLFGASVPETAVTEGSAEELSRLFLVQALYSLVAVSAYLLLYRPLAGEAARAVAEENRRKSHCGGFADVLRVMTSTPQFVLQLCSHGCFGAVGFVVPSAALFILDDIGAPQLLVRATGPTFIGAGVLGGVALGYYSTDARTFPRTLRGCYVLGSASLLLMCGATYSGLLDPAARSAALLVLMAAAGFATLGFTGVLFEDLARFPGIPPSYMLWIGYEIMLAFSVVLNMLASNARGFWTLAATGLVAALAFLGLYRQAGGGGGGGGGDRDRVDLL